MVNNYNSQVNKEIRDLGIVGSDSQITSIDPSKIVLTADVNPKYSRNANFIKSSAVTTTGLVTIYTVPAGKKLYLNSVSCTISKDVVSDSLSCDCLITIDGANSVICRAIMPTLTAGSIISNISFPNPIFLKAGDAIKQDKTHTVGSNQYFTSISACLVDDPTGIL